MTPGNAAAEALLARRGQPPAPPTLTLVATDDGSPCGRCRQPSPRLVPAYWGRDLCPACCAAAAVDFDRAGSWPPVPAVYPTDVAALAAVRPAEALAPIDPDDDTPTHPTSVP